MRRAEAVPVRFVCVAMGCESNGCAGDGMGRGVAFVLPSIACARDEGGAMDRAGNDVSLPCPRSFCPLRFSAFDIDTASVATRPFGSGSVVLDVDLVGVCGASNPRERGRDLICLASRGAEGDLSVSRRFVPEIAARLSVAAGSVVGSALRASLGTFLVCCAWIICASAAGVSKRSGATVVGITAALCSGSVAAREMGTVPASVTASGDGTSGGQAAPPSLRSLVGARAASASAAIRCG